MHPDESVIRERAYAIWLKEGCPSDAAERHWLQALQELSVSASPPPPENGPVIVAGPEAHLNEAAPKPRKAPAKKATPKKVSAKKAAP